MPMDMRDAIAHYLAYTGGTRYPQGAALWGGGSRMRPSPGGGPQSISPGPSGPNPGPPVPGSFGETYPPSDTSGFPQTPPSPDYTGPQPMQMPPVPDNLQGYERLPSGQFLPGAPPIGQAGPVNVFNPGLSPGTSDNPVVDPGPMPPQPPTSTPMQAPYGGQTVAGMDPAEWLRMYRGGVGA
jgi:hypothetical protein